ncbi:class I SAM-dependent RNA methyltransferase [Aureimonas mangrovi]|uniref:class I SAM-dependent RNA methyltransferase n=1 Tax=Aureimonas mangrovi TaxID=2758041 RepID=UPI00163D5F43|nr:class I SAM-dependent RNA methyltransferase [Aureimonas mangrovi]
MSETVQIEALGAKGDGIAPGPLYVPFALPGETVEVERRGARARPLRIVQPSAERREPPCPHFGACGGCDLQHASDELYRAFKRELVAEAFRRAGIKTEVAPLVPCAPGTRRRAVFTAVRAGPRVLLGFHQAQSHRIEDLKTCLVAVPAIEKALPLLRRLAATLIDRKRPLRLTVFAGPAGLDIAAEDAARLTHALRQSALTMALEAGLARLTVGGEVLVESRRPVVDLGGIVVEPPPGAFLQAVTGAEAQMATLVETHLEDAKAAADLFCGVGTFTLRLARHTAVHGVEGEAPALAALDKARRGAPGLKPVTSERRDLFRRPMTAKELARFDAVVFDPPRAGAEAQARELAASKVKRVAAVSCNPTTLARDAAILIEGGYALLSVTPIDQFLWSHHVEAVALFSR